MKKQSIGIWLKLVKLFVITIVIFTKLFSQSVEFRGQISTWATIYNQNDNYLLNGGVRFIPDLTLMKELSDETFIDFNISGNTFFHKSETDAHNNTSLYRIKLRYATTQSELRIGLQKINFGPGKLLRSLKWFDTVDPTDPLKITSGVYGIRYKYNYLNNSELWLWLLYGNDELKGNEFSVVDKNTPELGGRISLPVFDGELAGTFHTRKTLFNNLSVRENRFAVDGRWDIEVGFWFESVVSRFDKNILPFNWQNNLTLGMDYTFEVGNGLLVTAEHFTSHLSDDFFGSGITNKTTAMSVAYPFGLVDNFSAFVFYQWDAKKFYQTYQWNRIYDSYIINFNFYHYPESASLLLSDEKELTRAGYGFQLMIIYNF